MCNRLLSEFLTIRSHFRFFINFFYGTVDRSPDRKSLPNESTTQFDYYHFRLTKYMWLRAYFCTNLYRWKKNYLSSLFQKTSFDLYSSFKFNLFLFFLKSHCASWKRKQHALNRPIQQTRHVKRSTPRARGRSCLVKSETYTFFPMHRWFFESVSFQFCSGKPPAQ